ncbi:ExeM/NucH family extracellular endonuclease, partial [Spirosoma liriopis]|uniref:ExeM/NucH family extracellular endonuclease n=1 Tax=Spirosoma liriopis TaxID=2937440 RepID=UPI0021D437B1
VYDPAGLFTGTVGDKVRITGTVAEFTSSSNGNSSSLTQLTNLTNVLNLGAATLPTVTDVVFPVANVSDLERYEGMLVNAKAANGNLTVTEYFQLGRYGQVVLSATGSSNNPGTDARLDQYTQFNAPSVSGYSAYLGEIAKRRIILDDGSTAQNPDPIIFGRGGNILSASNTLRGGDEVTNIVAVLDERLEGYRLQTTTGVNFLATNPRPNTSPVVGGSLKVGSFNLLNYFNGNGQGGGFPTSRGADSQTEFARQRNKTIQAIVQSGVDVFALNELENDGYGANSAIQDLVNGVNAVAGAGTYAFINPNTSISSDEITVAMIYKPAKVTPVGAAATLTSSSAFNTVGRFPLAQTFRENATGGIFTAVANHFKSKGSSSGGSGDSDAGDGQGQSNGTRTRQAQDLATWLATRPTGTTDPDYMILGDLNAYAQEDPLTTLASRGYTNLLPNTSYSYVFDGQVGSLDHALGSASLLSQVSGAEKWHINSDEPNILDYNVEFKTTNQVSSLYNADQFRTSDHDPVIIGLSLSPPSAPLAVTLSANPTTLLTTSTTSLSATVSGGSAPYTYSFSGPGQITSTGNTASVSGLSAGVQTFTVVVRDATSPTSQSAVATASVTVSNPDQAPIASTIANQTATVGTAFTFTVPAFTDPENQTLTYAASGLPASLSFDPTTRIISGTPTVTGVSTLTITATDPASNTASATFSLSINAAAEGRIRITEYMYNGTPGEYVELTNVGNKAVDMTGWSYDDNSRTAGSFSLSGFGVVQPGESVVFTEADQAIFRTAWYLPASVKVIGGSNQNLGRSDEINIYDATGALIDRLTFNDQTITGSVRTADVSGWVDRANLGQNRAAAYKLSVVGDAQNAYVATTGNLGNPGGYYIPLNRVLVVESSGTTAVAEGGATDTYTIAFNSQPTSDVTVTINPGTQLTVNPTTLTFTPASYSVIQTVTVTAVDDNQVEGTHTAQILHSTSSTDPAYNGIATNPVSVTITDNDNPTTAVPTIRVAASTTPYLNLPAAGPGYVSGVINDPTDPAATLGVDFTLADTDTPVANLTVTASSNNPSVVSTLTFTGSNAARNLKLVPTGVGIAVVTVTVSDGTNNASYVINYAASAASVTPATTRFHTGTSDASTAILVDANTMLVADDENQVLRLYNRQNSGLPIAGFDFTSSLGLTDVSGGVPREVDLEASTRLGNRIFWMGSESNADGGDNRPNRNRVFATDVTGSGAATTLSYVGRYDYLRNDIIAWDVNNGHGKGANFYGLAASATAGVGSKQPTGFNIEGVELAPDNATAYVSFRAPQVPPTDRKKALIVAVTNFTTLPTGNGGTQGSATFGAPLEVDLGGRGIREIRKNSNNEYVIIAGPAGDAGAAPNDFRLYTWTGNPADAPLLRSADLSSLNANGSFESIVEVPSPLTSTSQIQLLVDNGDAVFYNNGTIAKDLAQNNFKKFRSDIVTLGTAPNTAPTVAKAIAPQSATVGQNYTLSLTGVFTDTETPDQLTLSVSGLPAGLSFTAPATISGVPSVSGVNSVTVTATDPGSLTVGTSFTITVSPVDVLPTVQLAVLQRDPDNGQLNTNTIKPYLQLRNDGDNAITYSQLTLRYWLTLENPSPVNAQFSYVQLGANNVHVRYVALSQPRQGATGYLEYRFDAAAGSLAPRSNSGDIQTNINKADYSSFFQGDDYSYALNRDYTPNSRITAYLNGSLVWGEEPQGQGPVVPTPLSLEVSANPTSLLTSGSTTLSANASGGNAPYSYSFQGPGTIQVNGSTATVSGLTAGVQTFTVTVTDAASPAQSVAKTVSVTVMQAPANTAPSPGNNTDQGAIVGRFFSYTVNAFTDVETPNQLTYIANLNPANGLSFDAASRILSGTPSTSGVVGVTITATDPGNLSSTTSFNISVSPAPVASNTQLVVLQRDPDNGQLNTNTIKPFVQVSNEGDGTIPYEQLTLRYWLTVENSSPLNIQYNYVQLGSGNVQVRYVPLSSPRQGATGYLEYRFTAGAGNLAPRSSSGEIQSSINKADYSGFNQGDDYSYMLNRDYAPNARITAYLNGELVYGQEPPVSSRMAAQEAIAELEVNVLGNPVVSNEAQIEISGAEGQPVRLTLFDLQGKSLHEVAIESVKAKEKVSLPVSNGQGVLLLEVSTPTQRKQVKLIKF